jgi:hypothetical protein
MSALGQKRTFRVVCATSALPPKARFQQVKLLSPDPSKYTFAFPLTLSPRWAFGRQQQIFIHEQFAEVADRFDGLFLCPDRLEATPQFAQGFGR